MLGSFLARSAFVLATFSAFVLTPARSSGRKYSTRPEMVNADADALNYFDYVQQKGEAACVVLENLMLTNYAASQTTNVGLGVNAQTVVTSDGVDAQMDNERSSSTELASAVIRCYQMYQVQLHQNRVVELVAVEP